MCAKHACSSDAAGTHSIWPLLVYASASPQQACDYGWGCSTAATAPCFASSRRSAFSMPRATALSAGESWRSCPGVAVSETARAVPLESCSKMSSRALSPCARG
eukprot:4757529-Prymnesium_polylepis.1